MKEIVCFETVDGRVFKSSMDAARHEAETSFYDWYEDNKCYGNTDGCRIEAKDMLEWLKEHKEVVLGVLGA